VPELEVSDSAELPTLDDLQLAALADPGTLGE
jgi:hypothetical protein